MALKPVDIAPSRTEADSGGGGLGGIVGAVVGAAAAIAALPTGGASLAVALPLIGGSIGTGKMLGETAGGIIDKSAEGSQTKIGVPTGASQEEMGPISRRFQGAGGGPNDILQSSIQAAQATPQVAQNPAIMNPLLEAQQKAKSKIGRA